MSTAQHTPGPWEMSADSEDSMNPAFLVTERNTNEWPNVVAEVNAEANARLIAAAPELLDALRDAMQAVEVFHGPIAREVFRDHSPEMKRWRAAIAKATGQEGGAA